MTGGVVAAAATAAAAGVARIVGRRGVGAAALVGGGVAVVLLVVLGLVVTHWVVGAMPRLGAAGDSEARHCAQGHKPNRPGPHDVSSVRFTGFDEECQPDGVRLSIGPWS